MSRRHFDYDQTIRGFFSTARDQHVNDTSALDVSFSEDILQLSTDWLTAATVANVALTAAEASSLEALQQAIAEAVRDVKTANADAGSALSLATAAAIQQYRKDMADAAKTRETVSWEAWLINVQATTAADAQRTQERELAKATYNIALAEANKVVRFGLSDEQRLRLLANVDANKDLIMVNEIITELAKRDQAGQDRDDAAARSASSFRHVEASYQATIWEHIGNAIAQWWEQIQQGGDPIDIIDGIAAGIGDIVTAGLLTRFREDTYGATATRNHQGPWFALGRVFGVVISLGIGFANPCNLVGASRLGFNILMGLEAVGNAINAYENFSEGNIMIGLLDTAGALFSVASMMRACFTGETPLLTPDGAKPIAEFQVGDVVLSRDENDPNGIVREKVVEEVFVRSAFLAHLHIGGQVIRTTTEHPFYVKDKGWISASELASGDSLISHNGQEVIVEEVFCTDECETVYNLRVSDFHTYFVGCDKWGFSVWAHNQCKSYSNADPVTKTDGERYVQKASEWWDAIPEKNRYGVTIAYTEIDEVPIVVMYANQGNRGDLVPKKVINNLKTEVENAGGVFKHTDGDLHAEKFLHQRYAEDNLTAIGISNPKGPCENICDVYFDEVEFYNVYWP